MSADSRGRLRGGKRKVQEKPDGSRFVTLPADLCEEAGIEKGDEIDFEFPGEFPIEARLVKDDE